MRPPQWDDVASYRGDRSLMRRFDTGEHRARGRNAFGIERKLGCAYSQVGQQSEVNQMCLM